MPTKFPASKQRKEQHKTILAIISVATPYRFPYTSGRVNTPSVFIFFAKKSAFKSKDNPRPIGNTAPSKNANL